MDSRAAFGRNPLAAVLLFVLTAAAFVAASRCQFVNYDDPQYVTENPIVSQGLTWDGILWSYSTGCTGNWHPVTWLSHMLDVQLFGLNPEGHHLTSVLFHSANAAVLFLFLSSLTGTFWRSLCVAALFMVHPLRVESVAWVAERKDVLSAFFGLLSLWAYYRFSIAHTKRSRVVCYWASFSLLALGLMSKPMLVTWPVLMLLLDWWPLRRMMAAKSGSLVPANFFRLALEKVPFISLAAFSCVVTFLVQRDAAAVSSLQTLPLGGRLCNAAISYVRYLGKIIWPADLAFFYPLPKTWPAPAVALAIAFLLAVTGLCFLLRKRAPYILVGWLWYLATLVPVIGLVQVGSQAMADRYTYIPSIGLAILVVWSAADLAASRPMATRWLVGAAAVLAGVYAGLTQVQLNYWRNSRVLVQRALAVTKDNAVAHNNLGTIYLSQGDWVKAAEHFGEAVHLEPTLFESRLNWALVMAHRGELAAAIDAITNGMSRPSVKAYDTLGQILWQSGDGTNACEEYGAALALDPDDFEARMAVGTILRQQGRPSDAVRHLESAVRLNPTSTEAHFQLGVALNDLGDLRGAAAQFKETVRLDPRHALARQNLGVVLGKSGEVAEATTQLLEAVRLNPDAQGHYLLALAFVVQGRSDLAIEHYREAIALRPGWPDPLNDLAWLLATTPKPELRDGAQAAQLAETACRLSQRKVARYLGTLDAAYAETGRFAEAISTAQEARSCALASGEQELAEAAGQRLELYRAGKAYHQP